MYNTLKPRTIRRRYGTDVPHTQRQDCLRSEARITGKNLNLVRVCYMYPPHLAAEIHLVPGFSDNLRDSVLKYFPAVPTCNLS